MKIYLRLTFLAALATFPGLTQAANSASQVKAASSADPSWFQTPKPQGTGARTITISSGQSLQDAFNKAQPGDTLEIGAGEYHAISKGLVLLNSGTPGQWITIRAASGATPKINLNNTGSFQIAASNVVVEGLEIVNGKGDNLHISPWKDSIRNIIVRGLKIHSLQTGSGAAIKINRNNPINANVEGVYIEDSDLQQPINNAVVDGVGVQKVAVRNCWIHHPTPGNSGVFFKGGSAQVLIEDNLISGIRGNSALMLGGNTGVQYFNPNYPTQEGVDQTARNNIIADYNDSAIEVRGVVGAFIYQNTIVGDSPYAAFHLQYGGNAAGGKSNNQQVTISDNMIVNTASTPLLYAWNDGNIGNFTVGPQLWAGLFKQYEKNGLPTFPQAFDIHLDKGDIAKAVNNPSDDGLTGLDDARTRYAPAAGGPAKAAAMGALKKEN